MFYTQTIMQASTEQLLEESLLAMLPARWSLVPSNTTGGTKAKRYTPTGEWTQFPNFETYNSVASQAQWGNLTATGNLFPAGTTYYEVVRGWDSAEVAQQFVSAVQALNHPSITINYTGATDPSAV
jgi:hypothetical protein